MTNTPNARPKLADQSARDQFTQALDQNFSVIASAGAGKTTAIVDRVVRLARADAQYDESRLPRLTVVTYGDEAAREMRRRSAAALRQANAGPQVEARFQQAYFGTIHSFCLELLRAYGPLAGLSPRFEVAPNQETLWREFLRNSDTILHPLEEDVRRAFSRLISPSKALSLVHQFGARIPAVPPPPPLPAINLQPVFDFKPSNRNVDNVTEGQRIAGEWLEAWRDESEPPCPPPEYTKGGQDFQSVWNAAWRPLWDWLGEAAHCLAAALAREFREYRMSQGQIVFDDMVALAARLIEHPAAGLAIRDFDRIVVLDEAQDTDWLQYFVLLNVAGAQWRDSSQLAIDSAPPPGNFCQVGDPQQAIYSSRADPRVYRRIHDRLIELNGAEELTFSVTMRCDAKITEAVNQFFPRILKPEEHAQGQARFVPLSPRPGAGPGAVFRMSLSGASILPDKPNKEKSLAAEARSIADWLGGLAPGAFDLTDWSHVAILAARNDWLDTLAESLEAAGLPVQAHSRAKTRAEEPIWAWAAGLVRVIVELEDRFELAGVLREIFAIPDGAIAQHYAGETVESVSQAMRALNRARTKAAGAPLDEAFREICDTVQLIDRLNSLPGSDSTRTQRIFHQLRARALEAEERGLSATDWSRELILRLQEKDAIEEPAPGRIQLLTCHKAKGLQWPVVIAPMLHLGLAGGNQQSYPLLYHASPDRPGAVAFNGEALPERKAEARQANEFELARLAYVTWTRAREKLILVDAASLAPARASTPWEKVWEIGADGANADNWTELPAFEPVKRVAEGSRSTVTHSPATEAPLLGGKPRGAPELALGIPFPQRLIPSSLAAGHRAASKPPAGSERDESDRRAEPGYPETKVPDGRDGADYGNWWHATMEGGPWGDSIEAWAGHTGRRLREDCPDPDRAVLEWEALQATQLFRWLNSPPVTVRAEAPLLWPAGARAPAAPRAGTGGATQTPPAFAYDGFIDLLAHDAESGVWRVIDWKTDRYQSDAARELREAYGRQLQAYVDALSGMFETNVEGWLYSTRAGYWIPLVSC